MFFFHSRLNLTDHTDSVAAGLCDAAVSYCRRCNYNVLVAKTELRSAAGLSDT